MEDPLRKKKFWSEDWQCFKVDQQRLRSFARVCSGGAFSEEQKRCAGPDKSGRTFVSLWSAHCAMM